MKRKSTLRIQDVETTTERRDLIGCLETTLQAEELVCMRSAAARKKIEVGITGPLLTLTFTTSAAPIWT